MRDIKDIRVTFLDNYLEGLEKAIRNGWLDFFKHNPELLKKMIEEGLIVLRKDDEK